MARMSKVVRRLPQQDVVGWNGVFGFGREVVHCRLRGDSPELSPATRSSTPKLTFAC